MVVKIPRQWKDKSNKGTFIRRNTSKRNINFLSKSGILAANAGAAYVSPFLGRLDDINTPGIDLIRNISEIFDIYGYDTEIIAASVT